MRELVLDTETTGLDPASGDRVVEIGCVELVNHFPTGETWHTYINPERDMPQAAYEVHKLSEEFLSDKPVFSAVAEAFLEFIGADTLVIHNASFDTGFLNAELAMLELPPIKATRVIDTLALARRKHPGASNSLDALCKRYQIDASSRTTHGALIDSELLAKVYVELIGGQQANLELSAKALARRAHGSVDQATVRPAPLPERLTAEHYAKHRSFVATLGGNAIWKRYLDAE
ncbi:MAG: DNA polymerase III subunit epsilon [Hyphomicrobiales bacterium]|nr:DNA polymerase III subunit epsilon [Hyphomicrobiales bacterium]